VLGASGTSCNSMRLKAGCGFLARTFYHVAARQKKLTAFVLF